MPDRRTTEPASAVIGHPAAGDAARKRKPDFVLRMQGENEVLEVYGWPLPKPPSKDRKIT